MGKHSVVVSSGHENGPAIASLTGFDFIAKDAAESPVGDVLIDDDAEQFRRFCAVTEVYTSLETFLESKSRSRQDT